MFAARSFWDLSANWWKPRQQCNSIWCKTGAS